MIGVTHLNGNKFFINCEQIESFEMNPDTTIVMLSGTKIIVKENPEELVDRVMEYKRGIFSIGPRCKKRNIGPLD